MLVELGFAGLVALAWKRAVAKPKMTEKLSENYLAALEHCSDSATLRKLAAEYERCGFRVEAEMLRKRAILRAMPKEQKNKFRALAAHAMAKPDSNPEALDAMANGFDAMTANGTARELRARARERREEILATAESARRQDVENAKSTPEDAAVESIASETIAPEAGDTIPASPKMPSETGSEAAAIHGE